MGNQILGKRSRSFYMGFNQRQVDYVKEKFSVMAGKLKGKQKQKDAPLVLDRNKFIDEYQLTLKLADEFFSMMNFDEEGGIDEYEFVCAVHSLCNMTVSELGANLFEIVTNNGAKSLKESQLMNFTEVCIKYNTTLENKTFSPQQLKKINKDKFKKYDYDKSGSISKDQFVALCSKDEDFKKWFFNMGFITKNQLQFNDQVYDLVDSDVDDQIQRHLTKTDPNTDRLKRGFENKIPQKQDFEEDDEQGDQSVPQGAESSKSIPTTKTKKKEPWEADLQDKNLKYCINQTLKQNPNSPSQTLTMKYIFGYRSYDCRENIKFDSKGNVVYHQAAVGIVMNNKNQQKFMNQHKDDIVCLDVCRNMVVTGEMGTQPSVILWDTKEDVMKSKLIITDQLKESVGNVAFNKAKDKPDFLAVNCNDSDHTLIVYKIEYKTQGKKQSIEASVKSKGVLSKNAILDLKFTLDSKFIVAASLKEILFMKYDVEILNASRGEFGQFSNSCALCLLPLKGKLIAQKQKNWTLSGMTNGSIYFWQEDKCKIARSGHDGSVSALALVEGDSKNLFISGDKSGKIIVWGKNLVKSYTCTIQKSQVFSNMIVSLSVYDKSEILVGTKSSTVYRATLQQNLILTQKHAIIAGHCQGNLWALSVQQTKGSSFFYTGGEDQRLMKWKYGKEYKLEKQIMCKYKIRSLSHCPKQKILAVGYMNGVVQIMSEDLSLFSKESGSRFEQLKNPDKEILNLVKFRADGTMLAVCYTNPAKKATWAYKVVFFSWKKALKKQKQIEFTSKVIALDFVAKGDLVRINTLNNEFDIYDISASKPILIASDRYKKIVDQLDWQNHTTFMSPQTKGFKIQGVSESDIVSCQRNRNNRNVVLFGDKYSNIKLSNYPCAKFPIFSKYQGHSNAITAMEFNSINSKDKQGQYLISIGGQEKSIIVWQYDPDQINNGDYFVKPKQNSENEQDNSFQKAKGQCVNATPHYKGQIKQPGHFKQTCNARRDNKPPKQDLSIQHVFGIRNQYINDQVRNTCRFTANYQSILFPTACLGVQMNIKTKEQTYYHEHKEDIVSFAVDQSRKLMATGQMAQKNVKDPRKKIVSVCVWELENRKLLKKLDGFHTIAVVLLDFSPSGKLLFSVGNDDKNTFAVYDWKAGSVIYSGPVSGGKVNGIAWKNQNEFMTCGMDHVKFWQKGKGKQGKFASKDKFQSMFSCLYYRNEDDGAFLTGGGNGAVFVWRGNQTVSSPREHGTSKQVNPKESKMKVHTIVQKQKSIYTGAEDGFIFQWKIEKDWTLTRVGKIIFDSRSIPKKLKCLIADQKNDKQDEQGILSIDFAKGNNDSVLVVTKGASVVMFRISGGEAQNIDVIHQGHYKGQLWGLGTFQKPGKSKFILTGGDDCTVRKWDLETKSQVGRIYFKNPIRAVDCQQSSDYMIVAADKKAQLFLLANNLQKKSEHRGKPFSKNEKSNAKQGAVKFDHFPWVEQIKFSPDGQKVCYGTHAQSQIGEIVPISSEQFNSKKTKQFKIGTSAVNHIDWSKNGQSIAINTQAWQYLLFNSQSGSALSATSLKDENWATYTRKYGFQSQGIFQGVDHTDINTICRMVTDEDKECPKGILAVGYDDQSIRLFSYPAYIKNQVHKQYFGHSSHVTKIKFIEGDHRMVSVGGLDRTVIVWKVYGLAPPEKPKNDDEDDGLDDLDQDVDVPARALKKKPKRIVVQDFTEVLDQGDQFMAIKPWVGAIKQPTNFFPKSKGQFPKASIQLSYVLGYRAKDCRQNLFYKDADTIIFHAAAVLIQQKISTKKQRLFNDHNDEILSIDYHRQKDIVATGELGPKPLVCVYKGGEFFKSFKAPVIKGVIAIAISPNGENVACVGLDDKHGMAVIELKSGKIVKLSETTNKLITKIKWINNEDIVTVGINFYGEWKYMKDSNLIKLSVKKSPKSNNVSLDISPGGDTILVGANFSSLFNYSSNKDGKNVFTLVQKSEQKSQGEKDTPKNVVECIKITDKFIACGMRSGEIFFLQKNLQIKSSIKLQQVLTFDFNYQKSQKLCIRAIDFWPEGSNTRVLVGTLGSQIYQFLIDKNCKPVEQLSSCILKGHYAPNSTWTNEVWGLTIPEGSKDIAISCSDDSTIRIWNISKVPILVYCHNVCFGKDQSQLIDPKTKQYPDNLRLRSIAVSPNNEYLAVGAFDGTLRIFKLNLNDKQNMIQQKALWEKKIAKQWISDIKFGFKTLIVGSHDNAIYIFGFDLANEQREGQDDQRFQDDTFSLKLKYKPMNKHSSYITHLDVSRDSCFLQSTCGAYQILFWDLNAGKQLPGGATMLKNEMWKTWTCNIGWPVQGIYPKEQDGTFINAVDRSNMTISGEKSYTDKNNSDFFLLAAGNDHGKVAVYNYPSLIKNSNYIEGKGHSSHVTTVRWMADDQHIISVGGEDQCVMVWKVTKNVTSPDEQKCEQKKKSSNSPSKKGR